MDAHVKHQQMVLAAIIPNRLDLLDKAMQQLGSGHFTDPLLQVVFSILDRYASVTGAVLRREALVDSLADTPAAKSAAILETYDYLYDLEHDEADFRWAIQQMRSYAAERATKDALLHAQAILTTGVEEHGTELKGHQAAREEVLARFAAIDRDLALQEAPEGTIQDEYQDIMNDYEERKQLRLMGRGEGLRFGIESLDNIVGGYHNGELNLIAGGAGSGKSSLTVALAWHSAVMQGKNVVFATTETLRPQIIRKLVARHSKLEQFGLPEGLNTRDLKFGTLNETEEIIRKDVIQDFLTNPQYGKIYVLQVPRGGSLSTIETKLTHLNSSQFHVDLGIIDYLALLRPGVRRNSEREEFSAIMRDAKSFAATFDDGRGLPLISPWQTNRAGQAQAAKTGSYSQAGLSDTSEAEKSSDVIISIHADDSTQRYADVRAQVLKNRDGETSEPIDLTIDYATCYLTERSVARMTRNTGSAPNMSLADLLN